MTTDGAPRIPVYAPHFGREEEELVLDCIRSSWVSAGGPYVTSFEQEFAARVGTDYGIAVSSGTAALHLILHAIGIGPGDEVLVPTLTFVATANAVSYTGATPVFVDVDPVTWTISPMAAASRISERTKAIIAVHLYGQPCRMDEICELARKHGIAVIEDAAEAHFARAGTRYVGSFGLAAAFSFHGNKTITTGEGGMVTTDSPGLMERIRHLRDHAMTPQGQQHYWHDEVGFNYRMSNLQAAVGLGQLHRVDEILDKKARITERYRQTLYGVDGLTMPPLVPGYANAYWLFSILVDPSRGLSRDGLAQQLATVGVETRPFFAPVHSLPPYLIPESAFPVATELSQRGISLPSSPALDLETISHVATLIRNACTSA